MKVKVTRCREGAVLPQYAKPGDAGFDLRSAEPKTILIGPGRRQLVRTGLRMEIPEGYCGLILGRSGLASKYGIAILGGVIDSSYRGEIGVLLHNTGSIPNEDPTATYLLPVEPGERIAQMLILPVPSVEFQELEELGETERGKAGFGSTGRA